MSIADKYPRCRYIKKLIENYTRDVIDWGTQYGNAKKYYGENVRFDKPYPYSEEAKQNLFDHFDIMFREADKKDWADLNGHILWYFRTNTTNSFAKKMFEIFDYQIQNYPLNDISKIRFLVYMFRAGKEQKFAQKSLMKIADYNPTTNQEITNSLFTRANEYLSKTCKAKRVNLIYMFFEKYADNIEVLSDKVVLNCADLYFKMANKLNEPLSIKSLEKLLTKETKTLYNNAVGNEPYVNAEMINDIFASYVEFMKKKKGVKPHLHREMKNLGSKLVPYFSKEEFGKLTEILTLPNKRKMSDEYIKNQVDLQEMLNGFNEIFERTQKHKAWKVRVDVNAPDFVPSAKNVLNYAQNLFNDAGDNPEKNIETKTLYKLLTDNAKLRGADNPQVDIFGNVARKNTIDKKLVKEVAAAYADFVEVTYLDAGFFNPAFHKNLTDMFKDIVTKNDYSSENVNELAQVLTKGAKGDRYFKNMANEISTAYKANKMVKIKAGRSL